MLVVALTIGAIVVGAGVRRSVRRVRNVRRREQRQSLLNTGRRSGKLLQFPGASSCGCAR